MSRFVKLHRLNGSDFWVNVSKIQVFYEHILPNGEIVTAIRYSVAMDDFDLVTDSIRRVERLLGC